MVRAPAQSTARSWLLAALLATHPAGAMAADTVNAMLTGNDLLRQCSMRKHADICFAYVEGVADSMARGDKIFGWRACIPEGVASERLRNVAVRFLKGHAELRANSAASLVAAALGATFPCPR